MNDPLVLALSKSRSLQKQDVLIRNKSRTRAFFFSALMATTGAISGGGLALFAVTVLPPRALVGLGAFFTGLIGAGVLIMNEIRTFGLISFLSPETQASLLETSLLDVVEDFFASTMMTRMIQKAALVAPLALVETPEERALAISNIPPSMKVSLLTTGLINSLPDTWQQLILPRHVYQARLSLPVISEETEEEQAQYQSRQFELTSRLFSRKVDRIKKRLAENFVIVRDVLYLSELSGRAYWRIRSIAVNENTPLVAFLVSIVLGLMIVLRFLMSWSSSTMPAGLSPTLPVPTQVDPESTGFFTPLLFLVILSTVVYQTYIHIEDVARMLPSREEYEKLKAKIVSSTQNGYR